MSVTSSPPRARGDREFIVTQMSRLNETLLVSFGAMFAENLPAVDRVVKILRELDRYHGVAGGAQGPSTRRKLLESLDSGAETAPCPTRAALDLATGEALAEDVRAEDDLRDPLAIILPNPTALADRLSQRRARNRNAPQPAGKSRFGSRDAAARPFPSRPAEN